MITRLIFSSLHVFFFKERKTISGLLPTVQSTMLHVTTGVPENSLHQENKVSMFPTNLKVDIQLFKLI